MTSAGFEAGGRLVVPSTEGLALLAAQQALEQAIGERDAALAAITKSDDPAVKAYIDALLAD